MAQHKITRTFHFCAGHRLVGNEGRCKNLHGHNFVVALTVAADELDVQGMVCDFSVLRDTFGKWIDQNLDHAFLVAAVDVPVLDFLSANKFKHYVLHGSPTCEVLAEHLLTQIAPQVLPPTVQAVKVRVYETVDLYAEEHE